MWNTVPGRKAIEGHEEHDVSLSYYHQYWERVEAMSNKWLFANQFEEITWNWFSRAADGRTEVAANSSTET